jgi:hypothetical protein
MAGFCEHGTFMLDTVDRASLDGFAPVVIGERVGRDAQHVGERIAGRLDVVAVPDQFQQDLSHHVVDRAGLDAAVDVSPQSMVKLAYPSRRLYGSAPKSFE